MKSPIVFVAVILALAMALVGCKKEQNNNQNNDQNNNQEVPVITEKPVVVTSEVVDITGMSAVCGGVVTSDNGHPIVERGVCYGTEHFPLVSGPHLVSEGGLGSFTVNLEDLEPDTTYYVKAYAINSEGIAYGAEVSFTTQSCPLLIKVIEENGLVHDGSIVDDNSPIKFGFEMSSSVGLRNLEITCSMALMGISIEDFLADEVSFDGETSYTYISDDIDITGFTGQITFTATVWDVESRSSTASLTVQLKQMAPTISLISEDGFLIDNQVINTGIDYTFGFHMTSSNAELSSLTITIENGNYLQVFDEVDLSGMLEYYYVGNLSFAYDNKDIIGECTITATVFDMYGQSSSASFTVYVNYEEPPLETTLFEWYRNGGIPGVGLEEFGLEWTHNAKDIYARIQPLEGVTLLEFDPSVWNEITTESQKATLFESVDYAMVEYNHVSILYPSHDYDDVIGTLMPDGTMHLIHVTHSESYAASNGAHVTISGEAK